MPSHTGPKSVTDDWVLKSFNICQSCFDKAEERTNVDFEFVLDMHEVGGRFEFRYIFVYDIYDALAIAKIAVASCDGRGFCGEIKDQRSSNVPESM